MNKSTVVSNRGVQCWLVMLLIQGGQTKKKFGWPKTVPAPLPSAMHMHVQLRMKA